MKNRKPHAIPLAASLAPRLARHLELFPAAEVTLPWHDLRDPERHGRPVTVRLVLSRPDGGPLRRQAFNTGTWWPAQVKAGITPEPGEDEKRAPARGDGCHALRHTAASVWLRAGIDVVRAAAWLGDTPAVVLSTYAHLMPGESGDDGRAAVDRFFGGTDYARRQGGWAMTSWSRSLIDTGAPGTNCERDCGYDRRERRRTTRSGAASPVNVQSVRGDSAGSVSASGRSRESACGCSAPHGESGMAQGQTCCVAPVHYAGLVSASHGTPDGRARDP